MSAAFESYLEAKFALDERSRCADVRRLFERFLAGIPRRRCLDLGAGTGASLRRLLALNLDGFTEVVAVERDPELLESARARVSRLLAAQGFQEQVEPDSIRGVREGRAFDAQFCAADILDARAIPAGPFDCVIAHQVMDLVPLPPVAAQIVQWLAPGGLFYGTLNYDGGTTLFPVYREAEFEGGILAAYDASMEARRVGGAESGGARSGRRLHASLVNAGLKIVAYGSSDWNLTPVRGHYRNADALCIAALLDMIHGEAIRSGGFAAAALAAWRRDRLNRLECGELGLIIHQLDLLAEKPA